MEVKEGYKQTEVGIIPEDWDVLPIGEAYEICNNLRLPISRTVRKQMEGSYPYYGPTSIQGYINEYRVEGEYALIGEDGDHFLKWREQPMTLLVRGRFNVNNHAHLIKGTKHLTTWFYYYFAHRDITPYLTRQGAGRFKLNKRTLVEIPCVLPPLAEQKVIAEALSDADALIKALEQLIAKKRQVKQGAMQELLTGKRRLPGFGDKWEEIRLGDLLDFERPDKYIVKSTDYFETGDIPVLTANKSFVLGYTDEEFGIYNNFPVIIFDDFTTDKKYVDFPFKVKSSAIKILKPKNNKVNLQFVFGKMQLIYFPISDHKRYYISEYQHIKIPMPGEKEQTAIAEILSDMDSEIAALEGKLSKARQVKQGMMSVLLTGRVRLV